MTTPHTLAIPPRTLTVATSRKCATEQCSWTWSFYPPSAAPITIWATTTRKPPSILSNSGMYEFTTRYVVSYAAGPRNETLLSTRWPVISLNVSPATVSSGSLRRRFLTLSGRPRIWMGTWSLLMIWGRWWRCWGGCECRGGVRGGVRGTCAYDDAATAVVWT